MMYRCMRKTEAAKGHKRRKDDGGNDWKQVKVKGGGQ